MVDSTLNIFLVSQSQLKGLDTLQKSLDTVGTKMDKLGNNFKKNSDVGRISFATMITAFQRMGDIFINMSQQIESRTDAMVEAFSGLELAVAKANTIIGSTRTGLTATGKVVDDVAASIDNNRSKVEIAGGAYQIYSTGITDAAMATIALDVATKASIAGFTTVDVSAKTLIQTMNAFGLEVDDLNRISDVFFNTIKFGVLQFEDITSSAGRLSASAQQAGQSLEITFSAFAALTKAGFPAQEAATRLVRALGALRIVTEDNRKELSRLGVEILDSSGNFRDLTDITFELKQATEGMSESQKAATIALLSTEKRAQEGISALITMNDEFINISKNVDVAGSSLEAYNEITETTAMKMERMNNSILNAQASLGEKLAPATLQVLEAKLRLIEALDRINPQLVQVLGTITILSGQTLGLIGPLVQLGTSYYLVSVTLKEYTLAQTAANFSLGVFLWQVLAVTIVIVLLILYWDEITAVAIAFAKEVWNLTDRIILLGIALAIAIPFFREYLLITFALVGLLRILENIGAFDYLSDQVDNFMDKLAGAYHLLRAFLDSVESVKDVGSGSKVRKFGGDVKDKFFANGGSFIVGGSGGTDTSNVSFRATPGERVEITTPRQQGSSSGTTNVFNFDFSNATITDRNQFKQMATQAVSDVISRQRTRTVGA